MRDPGSHAVWTVSFLGDSALRLDFGERIDQAVNDAVHAAAAWVRALDLPGCVDVVPAYASLTVHFDPSVADVTMLRRELLPRPDGLPATARTSRKTVVIPVRYGGEAGPDLDDVASHAGLSAETVIARHHAAEYRVMCLGFSPGFAYLGGLDPALATPRRATPRESVAAGSVGIGGAQTAVYPSTTPGGWQIIGRTDGPLFDPAAVPPSRLQPGDRVTFTPVEALKTVPPAVITPRSAAAPGLLVERPGLLTTVQDLGRYGYQHLGVSPGGALDALDHRLANLLVGNPEEFATLEITVLGPTLVASRPLQIALCGAPFAFTCDGRPLPLGELIPVQAGARLAIGTAATGARAYLAVAGGFDVPLVMGSRSTALRDRFGGFDGRALRAGDVLPIGTADHARQASDAGVKRVSASGPVRFVDGPHWESLPDDARQRFLDASFAVSSNSDRMGLRLQGPAIDLALPELISSGVATGTIQLPPDGHPIVLLADRQTIGGYPRLGEVIAADLPRLAQLRPGDALRFTRCTLADARAAWLTETALLERARMRSHRGGR